jgi:hypothetical protein
MVTFPVHVKGSNYRGADAKKKQKAAEENHIAFEIEKHLNEKLRSQTAPIQVYSYYAIASATGYSEEKVRDLCFKIDGGHNGLTAIKTGLTFEEAMEQNKLY